MNDEIAILLQRVRGGDAAARDALFTIVYAELKRLASSQKRRRPGNHSLNTTAIVHEAYGKLFHDDEIDCRERDHFFALAVCAMRQVLVDHARAKQRLKRAAKRTPEPLDDLVDTYSQNVVDLVQWNEALDALRRDDPSMALAVELRYFLQLSEEDVARMAGLSLRTLQRRWEPTRKRLWRHIGGG